MTGITLSYLFIFSLALGLSFLLVPISRKLALRWNILDNPGHRKTHTQATPYLGGVAIYLVFISVVFGSLVGAYFMWKANLDRVLLPGLAQQVPHLRQVSTKLFALFGGSTAILTIGLLDDVLGARFDYRIKFLAQFSVAIAMVLLGIRVDFLGNGFLNGMVTVLWIVGITNAFNLLDNMDGLASGVAYICAMLFFFVAARQGQFFIGLIYLALAGSLLGFLFFNFFPARIFLGDTGSLLIGFLMATIIVLQSFGTESQESFFPILMPVIILSLPIFDTLRVILIRIKEKRSIFQGDQCHISHKLVDLGMSRPQAVVTVYVMTFSLGIGCTILDLSNRLTNWIILAQVLTMILMIILLMEFSRKVPHGSD